ncbi:hypothetical protein [Desertimonas flava]|uniref:hypothetical protein n=1 Tax=Desertimonas flava TaxID=2064846 RepID=UPI000E357809|nr:hypothetical protein [Desertimonas flava]
MSSDDARGPEHFDGEMFKLELGVMRNDLVEALTNLDIARLCYLAMSPDDQVGLDALDPIKDLEYRGAEIARRAERLRLHMFGNDR